MEKNYEVYTSIKVLKKAYSILKEIGLAQLLSGKLKALFDVENLLDKLFETDNINKLLQIITKTKDDFELMLLQEVTKIINDFFSKLGKNFSGLQGLIKVLKKEQLEVEILNS